jgi:hypothetical protein
LLLSVGLNGGCALPEKVQLTETGAPEYQQLHIVYDIKTDQQNVRLDRPAVIQTVSHSSESSPHDSGFQDARLRLEIQYPYASTQPGFAHVTLRVLATGGYSGPTIDGMEEMLVIDVPKPEIDAVLFELARAGFFDHEPSTPPQSHLDVTFNHGQVAKSWGADPKLDKLVAMLRTYGSPMAAPVLKPERSPALNPPISRPNRSTSTVNLFD